MKKIIFFTLIALGGHLQTHAQDTYWGLNNNKRLNTKTHKIIDSRPDDADGPGTPTALSLAPRAIFDATGRCMFSFNRTTSDWLGALLGGVSAFPIYNDKCKQYMVVNMRQTAGSSYITFQKIDANGFTGEISSTTYPIAAPIDECGGSDQQNIVVAPKPGGGHYVYYMFNMQDPNSSTNWIMQLMRFNVDPDGAHDFTPTLINYGLPPIGGVAKLSQDRTHIGYRSQNNHLVVFDVSNGALVKDIAIGSDIYGIENYNDKWFYSTAVEMGYITETGTSKTVLAGGAKSDLSLAADGRSIFYGIGDPAVGPGSLGYVDAITHNFFSVPASGGLVYTDNYSYSLGNMVTSENTSIADGYDEYAAYTLPPGNTTWSPSSNPGTDFNGSGVDYPVYRFNTTLTIPAGSTLSLENMRIEMGPEAKILVANADEGKGWAGYLKMDNSTITSYSGSSCGTIGGGFWAGIQLFGKGSGYSQFPQDLINPYSFHHAKLEMINKSTLSYARLAVQTADATDYAHTGGGIINATDAYFLNNKKSVAFQPYKLVSNTDPTISYPEKSFFTNCEFQVDRPLFIGFVGFVSGSNLRGPVFLGCGFLNDYYFDADNQFGYGINGWEFGVTVGQTAAGKKSYFRNLGRGIEIANAAENFPVVLILNTKFENNDVGIKLEKVKFPEITGNEFLIPQKPAKFLEETAVGVILVSCYKYRLFNDIFTGIGIPAGPFDNSTGVLINDCGPDDNSIHSNTYNDLYIGNFVGGTNNDPSAGTGLRFECNTFNSNTFSIYSYGMAVNQGSLAKAAGNLFNNGSTFLNKIVSNAPIDYYYGPNPIEIPTILGSSVNLYGTNNGNDCRYDGEVPSHDKDGMTPYEGVNLPKSPGKSSPGVNNMYDISVSVLPNPMHDYITIKYQQPGTVQIVDMYGKIVVTEQLSGKQSVQQVDVRNLAPGTYFYIVSASDNIIQRGKLVKD